MLETFSDHLSLTSYYPEVNLLCNVLSIPALQMKFDDLSLSWETSQDLSNGSVQRSIQRFVIPKHHIFNSLPQESGDETSSQTNGFHFESRAPAARSAAEQDG